MSRVIRFLNPGKFRRHQEAQRLEELRRRDGETCSRCRRPIRFDLPAGHDMGAKVEPVGPAAAGEGAALDAFCLTHVRCNANAGDATEQVRERLRPKREAELFAKSRKRRRA